MRRPVWRVLLLLGVLTNLWSQLPVPSLAVAPTRELFATGDLSGTVLIRESSTGELLASKNVPLTRGITVLRFDPNAPALSVFTASGTGFLWNWQTGAITEFPFQPAGWRAPVPGLSVGHLTQLGGLASPSGKVLLAPRQGAVLTAAAASTDGSQWVCCWSDGLVEVRDGKSARPQNQFPAGTARCLQVFWSQAGILRTLEDKRLVLTNTQGVVVAEWPLPGVPSSLTASATAWFVGTRDGLVVTSAIQAGTVPVSWKAHEGPVTALGAAAEDGLLSAGGEGSVALWSSSAGELRGRLSTGAF